jgi:glycosyltransferase involved in cell wall biosynthesis
VEVLRRVEIHQLHPTISYGDAIGNHLFALRRVFHRWGYSAELFCQYALSGAEAEVKDYRTYTGSPENLLLIHYSTGSEIFAEVRALPDRKILVYHNLTPAHFFIDIDPATQKRIEQGRQELSRFVGEVELALAVSHWNAHDLRQAGFPRVEVLPILIEFAKYQAPPHPEVMDKYRDSRINWLTVARIAPNKRYEDIIRIFALYQKAINPASRLFLVGTARDMEVYFRRLQQLVAELGVNNVVFTGHVPFDELLAYYHLAHVFLCMSEHEGFGVPLLEAMHFNVPVIAYKAGAIPETLGGAGVLVTEKRFPEIAEFIHFVLTDDKLRGQLLRRQRERLQAFAPERVEERLKEILRPFLVASHTPLPQEPGELVGKESA